MCFLHAFLLLDLLLLTNCGLTFAICIISYLLGQWFYSNEKFEWIKHALVVVHYLPCASVIYVNSLVLASNELKYVSADISN